MKILSSSGVVESFTQPNRLRHAPPETNLDVGHYTTKVSSFDIYQVGILLVDLFYYHCTVFPEWGNERVEGDYIDKQELARRSYRLTGRGPKGIELKRKFSEDFLEKKNLKREDVFGGGVEKGTEIERMYNELRLESKDEELCGASTAFSLLRDSKV